ncbi:uncharacterized protein BYT42DRAFT_586929 [Radiomyces spectabilis]|uniref:uncharacterized protein n=1 Tax=Radiomyces spectabilis TaxID=64574 RepID=UPI00221F70AE|nr:uncharacterized protein BYT42DRAFT_586929 [Radiomyces spectabilis]KAI8367630.1 hypothetical protein BYT42DRAFT_586929 [Radiomyces spectabilis]
MVSTQSIMDRDSIPVFLKNFLNKRTIDDSFMSNFATMESLQTKKSTTLPMRTSVSSYSLREARCIDKKRTKMYNMKGPLPHMINTPSLSSSITTTTASTGPLSPEDILIPVNPPSAISFASDTSSHFLTPTSSANPIVTHPLRQRSHSDETGIHHRGAHQRSLMANRSRSSSTSSYTLCSSSASARSMVGSRLCHSDAAATSVGARAARALAAVSDAHDTLSIHHTKATNFPSISKIRKGTVVDRPYILSQDNQEQDRLTAQHYVLRTAFDGDFSAPLQSMLQKGCVVLDVGCGPGTWTMEMSTSFPKSTFIGLDQSTLFPRDIKPKNCHFRTCDITQLPLPFPDNSIDYIFQRDLNWALPAHLWNTLIKEYFRILRPGGWLELMEQDLESQSGDQKECYINNKLLHGFTLREQDPYIARRLPSVLAVNGFRRVESQFQSLPLGWGTSHASPSPCQHAKALSTNACSEFARAVASQQLFTLRSLQPWLSLMTTMNPDKFESFISELAIEWKKSHTYINWHCATAQKPYQ